MNFVLMFHCHKHNQFKICIIYKKINYCDDSILDHNNQLITLSKLSNLYFLLLN